MRTERLTLFLILMLTLPTLGNAQVYRHEVAPPLVTAEQANWLSAGEPLFYAGAFYDPSGPTTFFDGKVMVRTGTYESVPLYQDVTLEPYSIVYVPIGGTIVRPYERRREGPLVGTVGSRMPSRPIQRDVEVSARRGPGDMETPATRREAVPRADRSANVERSINVDREATAVGTTGVTEPRGAESIPGPRTNDGLWIEFDGVRWFASGPAVLYEPAQFKQVGVYHGSPVYREEQITHLRIFIALSPGGPLAPFIRRH